MVGVKRYNVISVLLIDNENQIQVLNSLHARYFFMLLLSSTDFSKLTFSAISFRNTIGVSNGLEPFSLTGSKLFAKVISRQQKLLLAWKQLITVESKCTAIQLLNITICSLDHLWNFG